MNLKVIDINVKTAIDRAKGYTESTAEYSESTYRQAINGLNRALGMLDCKDLEFPHEYTAEDRKTIEGLIVDLEKKIERANRYNGWVNYETWNAALWIDNDHWLYTTVTDYANEECEDQAAMARYLENLVTDDMPDLNGMYGDILGAAMREIDWYEVAEHFKPDEGWISERESDPDNDSDDNTELADDTADHYLSLLYALRLSVAADIKNGTISYDEGMQEIKKIQADIDEIEQK